MAKKNYQNGELRKSNIRLCPQAANAIYNAQKRLVAEGYPHKSRVVMVNEAIIAAYGSGEAKNERRL